MANTFTYDLDGLLIAGIDYDCHFKDGFEFDPAIIEPYVLLHQGRCSWDELLFATVSFLKQENLEWLFDKWLQPVFELLLYLCVCIIVAYSHTKKYISFIENLFPSKDGEEPCPTD